MLGSSLVFSGSAGPVQPGRKKCKRKKNAAESFELGGRSVERPCTLPALNFADAVSITGTVEVDRFDTWVEDVFEQTSRLQCSHFLPFTSLSFSPRPESVQSYGSQILLTIYLI